MKFRAVRFNSYLFVLLAAWLTACESTNPGGSAKAANFASLRIHLETYADTFGLSRPISVGIENPEKFSVTPPMFSEEQLEAATVWEGNEGQFAIHLKFDRAGTQTLEMLSLSYRGKRLAIGGQFPESRWLGTMRMDRHIPNGTLLFRPLDITREEADKYVRMLNNTVAKLKKFKD